MGRFGVIAKKNGLSERLGDQIITLLSKYLDIISREVNSHGGTIDKFIGDAVMAFWGALFFFSSRGRHTRWNCDWSSDVCSSDLRMGVLAAAVPGRPRDLSRGGTGRSAPSRADRAGGALSHGRCRDGSPRPDLPVGPLGLRRGCADRRARREQ